VKSRYKKISFILLRQLTSVPDRMPLEEVSVLHIAFEKKVSNHFYKSRIEKVITSEVKGSKTIIILPAEEIVRTPKIE
jgi:hypothetical protein